MTAQTGNGQHRIVVGVDGSVPSKAALAWAITQARLTGAVVEAVIAWEFPTMVGYPMLVSDVDWEDTAEQVLRHAVADVVDDDGDGAEPVKITNRVMRGNAAQALIDESAGADLLVVGSRGHGGFVEALLGSTGQHCVQHAACPVVVIRDAITGAAQE
jgi:nucleotide-binding universal stress UspA family protein